MKLPVKITSNYPMCIEIDVDKFGAIFADMAADEQVATLAAMVEHMKPHHAQWDYISIELRNTLRDVLFPVVAKYPVPPRLNPPGDGYICDECGREWGLMETSGCDLCREACVQS